MSFATSHRQPFDGFRFDANSLTTANAPALHTRAVATIRQSALDRRLADGENTIDHDALTVRAWQITRPAARVRLAAALDAILDEAEQQRRARSAAVPVTREEVEVARGEIKRLAKRLRDPRPVRPRGVALVRQLLADGNGPLYVASGNDELWRQLRRAGVALD